MKVDGRRVDIALLADLAAQLRLDAEAEERALQERDRAIGRETAPLKDDPPSWLAAWLERVADRDQHTSGERCARTVRAGLLILCLAGLMLGWAAASVLFRYDGSRPVNVVHVLAVFVGLQWALLFLLGAALLPSRATAWIPGARSLQETLLLFSPGQLLPRIARLFSQATRGEWEKAAGAAWAHGRVFGLAEKWLIASGAQAFAVAFNVGALAGAFSLVAFSDLAFGWSTTLRVESESFYRLIRCLATPWAWLASSAAPSLDLVEATRYFRLRQGLLPGASAMGAEPSLLGGWWPFLLACMGFYGLLPRLLTLAWTRMRLAAAIRGALFLLPGVAALLERLDGEWVETRAISPEAPNSSSGPSRSLPETASPAGGRQCVLINWAGVGLTDAEAAALAARSLSLEAVKILQAGGARPPEEDEKAIAAAVESGLPALVLVKSWEPPILDLIDFLRDLRAALGGGRPILVAPISLDRNGKPAAPVESDVAVWRHKMQTLGDPWLSIRTPSGGGAVG